MSDEIDETVLPETPVDPVGATVAPEAPVETPVSEPVAE